MMKENEMKLSGKLKETGLDPFISEKFKIGPHLLPKIWIVVLDASQVYFFRKSDHYLEKIGESFPAQEAKRQIQGSGGGGRTTLEVHDAALKQDDERFMKVLAAFLDEAAVKKAYDRLVLAATPHMLGILRPQLSHTVHQRISAELDKDLTHLSEQELYDYLSKIIWVNN